MSSNLDKSLDEIISSKPKRTTHRRKATGVSKTSASKKKSTRSIPTAPAAPKRNPLDEASKLADRIIISNLPTDVTEAAVSDYFSHEVGPISSCKISYNSKGQSTGVVSITFKRAGDAHKASLRFNGTAIDNGAKRMKVEIVMDPTKKPLSTRLNPLAPESIAVAAKAAAKSTRKTSSRKPSSGSGSSSASAAKGKAGAARGTKGKTPRRPKKSLEELDAEMEDYFENKA